MLTLEHHDGAARAAQKLLAGDGQPDDARADYDQVVATLDSAARPTLRDRAATHAAHPSRPAPGSRPRRAYRTPRYGGSAWRRSSPHPPLRSRSDPATPWPTFACALPARGNRRLERLLEIANADERLKAWWRGQEVTATRLGMSDHGWVHVQIVLNVALRLFRLLERRGIEPAMVTDHAMRPHDAEVVIACACLLHDTGMSIHRTDHEQYSLFLAADALPVLLADLYEEPERTVVTSEILHAIIAHRRRGEPMTLEAGVVRVADALDLAKGRSRVPFESGRPNIHSLSAAAIDDVKIEAGDERAVRIEIAMNNSAGVFQVDELLATKLRGSALEEHLEVVARIDAEHEKRLVPVFRI